MKNLNLNYVLILAIGLMFFGCAKDNDFAQDVEITQEILTNEEAINSEDTPELMRVPFRNPCYPSPYEILPNVNSQYHCEIYYGCIWYNGSCYWCW